MSEKGPVVLVVLDGFGIGVGDAGDATALARAPFFASLARYPHAKLETSGAAVGLPDGQMGNSEVGHMTMGAGRVIDQDIVRIQKALDAGALEENPAARALFEAAARAGGALHLFGLVSDGGVHSSLGHLERVIEAAAARGLRPILHAFTDGRDTPPQSALRWIAPLERRIASAGGCIATLSGRYWAMDRDKRWDRVARAYRAIVLGEGHEVSSAVEAIEKGYARGEGDEFIEPSVIRGAPSLASGDAALFFNFRADRVREIGNALGRTAAEKLGQEVLEQPSVELANLTTFTMYDEAFDFPVLFAPHEIRNSLGELVSRAGMRQLRIAETEKYAHVTYFFSCGREEPFDGEDRILVPSPKDVATYDQKPQMSAVGVTDRLLDALARESYDFVLVNYANPDMVGHTGVLPAAIEAVEVVDRCLDRICGAVLAQNGTLLITADHGNVEQMIDPETGGPHTAHTTNPVPVWWISTRPDKGTLEDGGLADVAPTLCRLLGLEVPPEMTGRRLIRCPCCSSS